MQEISKKAVGIICMHSTKQPETGQNCVGGWGFASNLKTIPGHPANVIIICSLMFHSQQARL